jgi:hypothetical protein
MRFVLSDNSLFDIPRTLMIDRLMAEPDYEVVRSPFSTVMTVAGDGLPKAEPFNISGTAYFADGATATQWIFDLRDALPSIEYLVTNDFAISLSYVDFTVVPTLLPRILNVTMKLYPADTMPILYEWPSGLIHEYRFDEGSGIVLNDYVGGQDGQTFGSPTWTERGLTFTGSNWVQLPSTFNATLESDDWTQFVMLDASSDSPAGAGIVGSLDAVSISGEMYRYNETAKTSFVTGTNIQTNAGGDLWGQGPKILHSTRSGGGTRAMDTKPDVDPSYFYIMGGSGPGTSGNRTLGANYTQYFQGEMLYYIIFDRYLFPAEKEVVYELLKLKAAARGVSVTW